jgi:ribosome-associated protein
MSVLKLRGEHITLAKALKASGLAETGGQAKVLTRDGRVTVNGTVETHPGRKLGPGDRFRLEQEPEWTVEP